MQVDNLKFKFLEKPISSMPVSDEFKAMARVNHFESIGAILDGVEMKNFTTLRSSGYRMLKELLDILDKEGLMDLVEND